uniref:Uncharacterized protein n=1 Tax=Anas zonorhyncha TaxID=75864 RepID=A0A8B9ZWK9_9AVES
MARWLREHLGFRSAKPAPPAPPKPDYRAGPPQPPPPPGGAAEPLAAAQPDIVAAYRLQKERDFEDPYSGAPPSAAPDGPRYVSPKHRLIKVEATRAWRCLTCGGNTHAERNPLGSVFTQMRSSRLADLWKLLLTSERCWEVCRGARSVPRSSQLPAAGSGGGRGEEEGPGRGH